jgi:hypothetical protein
VAAGYRRCVRSAGRDVVRPERPGLPRRSRLATVVVAVAAILLAVYGLLALVVASAWGPGNSDELVSGGAGLIPWVGLSLGGAVAALGALWGVLVARPLVARWALLIAAVSLAGWTLFLFVGTNAD